MLGPIRSCGILFVDCLFDYLECRFVESRAMVARNRDLAIVGEGCFGSGSDSSCQRMVRMILGHDERCSPSARHGLDSHRCRLE